MFIGCFLTGENREKQHYSANNKYRTLKPHLLTKHFISFAADYPVRVNLCIFIFYSGLMAYI